MKQHLSSDLEVRQSNVLTNARSEYSELQLDLFFFILSRLRKTQDSLIYQLNIKELSTLTGNQYHLPHLMEATEGMIGRVFTAKTERGPGQFAMLQSAVYITGTRIIEVELTRLVLPHLFDLKDNFTSYALAAALRLTSKYGKRIYQLCSQWKDVGETKKYDLQDLKKMLGLIDEKGNEKLKEFTDFRKTVLDVAVKQINEHTELHVSYKLEKAGRSYKNVIFIVNSQALAHTIPFDLVATDTPLPGVQQSHYDNATRILDELRITDVKHRQTILSNPAHVAEVNRYNHDLKTSKVKANKNPGGLLLVRLGLVAAKTAKAPTT
jgi:plasmid replication initiation protein